MSLLLITFVFCMIPIAGIALELVELLQGRIHHAIKDCFHSRSGDDFTRSVA